jgi:hypothetical protein
MARRWQSIDGSECLSQATCGLHSSCTGYEMGIEGAQKMAFHLRTNAGLTRLCVVTKDYAAAYEGGKGPTAGQKLSHVGSETITEVIDLAKKHSAPVALDLLLRKAGIDPKGASISAMSIEPSSAGAKVNWVAAVGTQVLFAQTTSDGALLRTKEQ